MLQYVVGRRLGKVGEGDPLQMEGRMNELVKNIIMNQSKQWGKRGNVLLTLTY